LATRGGREEVGRPLGEGAEEKIFADPYYWAPFILVGDHESLAAEEE
jgi:CHAT domain-containing protein